MRSSALLTALATCAAAAPRPGPPPEGLGPSISLSAWTVRADWSRCANATAYEAILAGQIAAPSVAAGTGIVDFQIPANGFTGDLVLKPAGSLGFGSPYPPARIEVAITTTRVADGKLGVATYLPAQAGATSFETIAQVAWFADATQATNPLSTIEYAALQQNVLATAATSVEPSFLRVYYCSSPEQLPVSEV